MISVLIPIFNFSVVEFVRDLHQQASQAGVDFEIRCYDDGSAEAYRQGNQCIREWEQVVYQELPENIGRSRIRNRLARDAAYHYLLFADCDARTTHSTYIQHYVDVIRQWGSSQLVVYGGHEYPEHPPSRYNALMHWTYGRTKDQLPAESRKKNPYVSFKTINFLIARSLFLNTLLDEQLQGYGHEDTLMALRLRQRQVPIHHIDNPLCHLGLVDNHTFLEKTQESVRNVAYLIRKGYLKREIKLSRTYFWLKWLGLRRLGLRLFERYQARLNEKLLFERPSLRLLDIYKLGLLLASMAQLSEETKS
jgi:hypothetical protein